MNKSIYAFIIISFAIIMSCSSSKQGNFKSPKDAFTVKETFDLLKGDVLLIDVRSPDEIKEIAYDVKKIIYIPMDSIEHKMDSIPKNKQVILVCKGGGRSQNIFEFLKENGFTNVANMEGGIMAWDEAGLPTIKGWNSKLNLFSR